MADAIQTNGESSEPIYNLKAVVMETGLKPPTIRAWERRYGMPQPQRSEGGHRLYSQHDIDALRWLVARQTEGLSISHAVELWQSLVERGQDPLREQPADLMSEDAPALVPHYEGTEIEELRQAWMTACLAFDRVTAEQVLANAFALFPPEVVSIELLQTSLSEIGNLWYAGEISVQQEHFTSAISAQHLDRLIAAAAPPLHPERVIIASAQDDHHVFSPLLLTFLLRRRGWDVLYLGADVPVAELADTIAQIQPRLLILAAQMLSTAAHLVDVTKALADSDVAIAYGGLIFNIMPQLQQRIPAHYLGPTIEGAVPLVEQLLSQEKPLPSVRAAAEQYEQARDDFTRRRSLIESHIWKSYAAAGRPTEHLTEMNSGLAGIIQAALAFGDPNLLGRDMAWIQDLMASYRLSEGAATDYIVAYHEAAEQYLADTLPVIVDWLSDLVSS